MYKMAWHDMLIAQGLEKLFEWIDEIDIAVLKGLTVIAAIAAILYIIGYFLAYQAIFEGKWIRAAVIVGIWLFAELANLIGGGHDNHFRH